MENNNGNIKKEELPKDLLNYSGGLAKKKMPLPDEAKKEKDKKGGD